MTRGWSLADLDVALLPLPATQEERRAWQATGLAEPAALAPMHIDVERLPSRLRVVLDEEPEPGRRSTQTFHLLLTCIEGGLPAGAALFLCQQHRPTLDKWQRRAGRNGGRGIADQVLDVYAKHDHVGQHCFEVGCLNRRPAASPDIEILAELFPAFCSMPWPPKTRNLRDVLIALIRRACKEGSLTVAGSGRDVAMEARMHENTAFKWLREGERRGLWKKILVSHGTRSAYYRLSLDEVVALNPQPQRGGSLATGQPGRGLSVTTSAAQQDLARPGRWRGGKGLGKTPDEIYNLLCHSKLRVDEIAEATACSRRTAKQALLKLHEFGAVEEHDGRWYAAEGVDWDAEAVRRGVVGRVQHQRDRIAEHRKAFAEWCESEQQRKEREYQRLLCWVANKIPCSHEHFQLEHTNL